MIGQEQSNTKPRKWKQLSEKEQYQIEILLKDKQTPIEINKRLGRDRRIHKLALNNLKWQSIEERPKSIDNRQEMGHWEMDCVVGNVRAVSLSDAGEGKQEGTDIQAESKKNKRRWLIS